MKQDRSLCFSFVFTDRLSLWLLRFWQYIYSEKKERSVIIHWVWFSKKCFTGRLILLLFFNGYPGKYCFGGHIYIKQSQWKWNQKNNEENRDKPLYIPERHQPYDFYSANNTSTFPEDYVDRLCRIKNIWCSKASYRYLQVKYPDWTDPNGSSHQIVLFGYKDEAMQRFLPRQETMGFDVEKGTVHAGALIA